MQNLKIKLLFVMVLILSVLAFAKKNKDPIDLYYAAKNGSIIKIDKRLIVNKDSRNQAYDENGDSLLLVALENSRGSVFIKELLELGVNPDTENKNGDTALIYAVKYKAGKNTVKMLITRKSNKAKRIERIKHKNNSGKTAIDFAIAGSSEEKVLKKYIKKYKIVFEEPEEKNPKGNETISDFGIGKEKPTKTEGDVPIPDEPISIEIQKEEPKKNYNGRIYLFDGLKAFETYDDSQELEELIKQPNKQDKNGRTLLHNAAAKDDIALIQHLFESGANVNLADNDSWNALMFAARFAQKRETIVELLKGGANANAKNHLGQNALEIAASYNSTAEVLDELAKCYQKTTLVPAFIAAVGLGRDNKIIEVFLEHGVTPNLVYKGKTPLMYAAESNTNTDCIEFLLKKGADKTFVTSDRKDAYYFASKNHNLPHNSVYWSLNNSGN